LIVSFTRTIVLYLVLIGGMRLLGKRQIGQLEPSEFVVTMLISNLASIPMQNTGIALYSGLVPLLTVLGLELLLSGLVLRSVRLRQILCGKPVILVENGRILQENLRRTRVTLDELASHLRQKDVLEVSEVQYAILETDGNISVFPYPAVRPARAKDAGIQVKKQYLPYTLIADGYLYESNLKAAGKDTSWLEGILEFYRTDQERTWLLTVDDSGKTFWLGKDEKT